MFGGSGDDGGGVILVAMMAVKMMAVELTLGGSEDDGGGVDCGGADFDFGGSEEMAVELTFLVVLKTLMQKMMMALLQKMMV